MAIPEHYKKLIDKLAAATVADKVKWSRVSKPGESEDELVVDISGYRIVVTYKPAWFALFKGSTCIDDFSIPDNLYLLARRQVGKIDEVIKVIESELDKL